MRSHGIVRSVLAVTAIGSALPALIASALFAGACRVADRPIEAVRLMQLEGVKIDVRSELPVLFLRERGGRERELRIWVGGDQARSIALALENFDPPRPNTHDLITSLLDELGGAPRRIVVTELIGSTYYAVIEIEVRGRIVAVDARPSDAIAIAVRTGTPVYASESLLEENRPVPDGEDATDIDWPRESHPQTQPEPASDSGVRQRT